MGNSQTAFDRPQSVTGDNLPFRELLDASPVACYATDAGGRLTYFNRAAIELSGRVPELGTDTWCVTWRLYTADGQPLPKDQCPMALALRGEDVQSGQEYLAERPDGTRFWFTPYPSVIRDTHGRITGGLNLLVDVTERKLAAKEREEHFRAVFETTPECVMIVAADGTLLQLNSAGLGIIGAHSPESIIGGSVYDLIAPEDVERFRDFHARVCSGEKGSLEFDIVGRGAARLHVETYAAPLRHSDGTTGHLAVTRDVTAKAHGQRAALLLSAIVDSSEDAIISKDLNGTITSWNQSAERLFGYTAEEAIGQSVAALLIPADRQDEEPDILARLRRGERVEHFQTVRKRKDGTLIDISLTISPVKDTTGRIVGASKIARDVTWQVRSQKELRQANESLSRSNADLEQFAYSASHDLQEPLRMVSIYSEMLRKKFAERLGSNGDEYIGYVVEGARRMDRLLRDLRAFTHASVANLECPPTVDAAAVLQRILTGLKTAIDQNDAEITAGPLPLVRLHEFQLEQLFQNLVGNALRYRSEARPTIHIRAERDGDTWTFSVTDNGIGIDPEYKEQIFGIFKRLHTASEYPGTGMGLAICQRIVERTGGKIWVESQPGRGSTFFFTLPAGSDR